MHATEKRRGGKERGERGGRGRRGGEEEEKAVRAPQLISLPKIPKAIRICVEAGKLEPMRNKVMMREGEVAIWESHVELFG